MYAYWISSAALIIMFPCDAGVKYFFKSLGVEMNIFNILYIQNVGAYFVILTSLWHHFWIGKKLCGIQHGAFSLLPSGGTKL